MRRREVTMGPLQLDVRDLVFESTGLEINTNVNIGTKLLCSLLQQVEVRSSQRICPKSHGKTICSRLSKNPS